MATYSTLSEARTAYLANADYGDGSGDVTKARAFRAACRSLLILLPQTVAQSGTSTTMSVEQVRKELDLAEGWLALHDSNQAAGGRVTYANIEDMRQ